MAACGVDQYTFHIEATTNVPRTCRKIRDAGMKVIITMLIFIYFVFYVQACFVSCVDLKNIFYILIDNQLGQKLLLVFYCTDFEL